MEVVKFEEPWGLALQQVSHTEALMLYGERVVVRLKWTIDDFRAGLVDACTDCQAGTTQAEYDLAAAVFKSSGDEYCPTCFGTRYVGGFQPTAYVTWAMCDDEPANWEQSRSGLMQVGNPKIDLPWEPEVKERDLVVRVREWDTSGPYPSVVREFERYQLREVNPVTLKTGAAPHDPPLYVGQLSVLENLPTEHPFRQVPLP